MNKIRRRILEGIVALVVASASVFGLGAGPARAGDDLHEITWGHQTPDGVRSFVLYVSPQEGALELARRIEVGKPTGENIGFMQLYSALVPMASDEFVAVAAIGRNGLPSPLSAWSQAKPSQPGQPVVVEP